MKKFLILAVLMNLTLSFKTFCSEIEQKALIEKGKRNLLRINHEKSSLLIDEKDGLGLAPIHYAAIFGPISCLKVLIDLKANLENQDNEGWTALHLAVHEGRSEAANLLLSSGAKLSTKNTCCNEAAYALSKASPNHPKMKTVFSLYAAKKIQRNFLRHLRKK